MTSVSDRWPLADARRVFPVSAYKGETDDATAALHERMYLGELDRQARIFNQSFFEAMTAALVIDDADECWRQMQGALFAAIIVSRLVDPREVHGWPGVTPKEAKGIAMDRADRIRQLVGLPGPSECESPIYAVRDVRDAMEHFDERLDRIVNTGDEASVSDWYLSNGMLSVTVKTEDPLRTPLGLRAFLPTAGMLFFNDQPLNMFQLDLDMFALRNNIVEARTELEPRLKGPFNFGGPQVVEFSDAATRLAALGTWEAERDIRVASLNPVAGDHSAHLAGDVDPHAGPSRD